MWKAHQAGVRGYLQYTWLQTGVDPYYPLDGWWDESGAVYPDGRGNLCPTARVARIRTGIDDYRYTLALSRAVEAAKDGPKKLLAAEAKAYLDAVLGRLKFENTSTDRRPQMTETELDQYRARVQDYLVQLMGQ